MYLRNENDAVHDNQPTLYKLRSHARLQGAGCCNLHTFLTLYDNKDEQTSGRKRNTSF